MVQKGSQDFGDADNSPKTHVFIVAVLLILNFMRYAVEATMLNYYSNMLYNYKSMKCSIPAIINYCFSIIVFVYFLCVFFSYFSFSCFS